MRLIGNMTAVRLVEEQEEKNGLVILSNFDNVRRKGKVIAAGDKSSVKAGDTVILCPDFKDNYDPESKTIFIRDFKITAVIK